MNYKDIAESIINLKNEDLELRASLAQSGQLREGYNREMEKLHNRNADLLSIIIDTIGYPTIDKVGQEASAAAWLIIQHSIGKPVFMKRCAKLLENAVSENKADPIHLAYLTDRIAVFEGEPQSYGTQFDWDENGELSPNLCDDLEQVNQRRKSIGLNSLEEQTAILRQQAIKEAMPVNPEKRSKEYNEWRQRAGWTR